MGSFYCGSHIELVLQEIVMIFRFPKEIQPAMEVIEYHLIFNLNGVLVATRDSQITRSRLVVLKLGLKEFFSSCIIKFRVDIWFLEMKRNFARQGINFGYLPIFKNSRLDIMH